MQTARQNTTTHVFPAWKREGTAYVVGVDGVTLDVVNPMVERGELPNMARLVAEGCHGPLQTISPTNSSLLWTSIATGRHHRHHGIDGFKYYRVAGLSLNRSDMRRARKVGLRQLLRFLKRAKLLTAHRFSARHVKAKRFWELLSEAGDRVGVVNWWHTWPADTVNGFVVSDRLLHWRSAAAESKVAREQGLTYPEELLEKVQGLLVLPIQISSQDVRPFVNLSEQGLQELVSRPFEHHEPRGELRFLIAADKSCWNLLEYCLNAYTDLKLAAVYFRGTDIASHCAFGCLPWVRGPKVNDEERTIYGNLVQQAYRVVDEVIGKLLARMRPEDTLIVLSDHGFCYDQKHDSCNHRWGTPPGVLYAYGKEFQRGAAIANASIYDLAPTVLRVCGYPPALDFEGRCLEELLTPEFRREHPPLTAVSTYGPRRHTPGGVRGSPETDKQIEDHLRALGYLD